MGSPTLKCAKKAGSPILGLAFLNIYPCTFKKLDINFFVVRSDLDSATNVMELSSMYTYAILKILSIPGERV